MVAENRTVRRSVLDEADEMLTSVVLLRILNSYYPSLSESTWSSLLSVTMPKEIANLKLKTT